MRLARVQPAFWHGVWLSNFKPDCDSDHLQEPEKTSIEGRDENTLARRPLRAANVVKTAGLHLDRGDYAAM